MNIQSKLSVTYILLLIIGIITISAYAILSIRFFLFAAGLDEFKNDMRIVRQAVESSDENTDFFPFITETTDLFEYDLALFDSTGIGCCGYHSFGIRCLAMAPLCRVLF